jgi:hypothetical protein
VIWTNFSEGRPSSELGFFASLATLTLTEKGHESQDDGSQLHRAAMAINMYLLSSAKAVLSQTVVLPLFR